MPHVVEHSMSKRNFIIEMGWPKFLYRLFFISQYINKKEITWNLSIINDIVHVCKIHKNPSLNTHNLFQNENQPHKIFSNYGTNLMEEKWTVLFIKPNAKLCIWTTTSLKLVLCMHLSHERFVLPCYGLSFKAFYEIKHKTMYTKHCRYKIRHIKFKTSITSRMFLD